jgi:hypothetical protein
LPVLNLIIDNAPTRPRESTMLVFMVMIIKNMATANNGKRSAVIVLLETELENFL